MTSFDDPRNNPNWLASAPGAIQAERGSHLEFISGERDEHEFEKAQEHSRRVRTLKFVMPIVGLLIIATIAGVLIVRQFVYPSLNLGAIALQDGKLVMENPSLSGVDQNKRPFSLSAKKAIQDASQPKRVELITIEARLPLEEALFADVAAGRGVYDADEKILELSERVQVTTTDGMRIELEDANIDIGSGKLETSSPIFASSPQADIMSDRLTVEDNGKRIIFDGKVRMTLRPAAMKEAGDKNE